MVPNPSRVVGGRSPGSLFPKQHGQVLAGSAHAWAPPSAEGSEERQLQAPEPLKASLALEAVAREKLTP